MPSMTTQDSTTVRVKRGPRKVVVELRDKPKTQPEKPHKAGGLHIRMAIRYKHNTSYHATMTESEARELADVLLDYAERLSKESKNSN
jgi:hypothetical protein